MRVLAGLLCMAALSAADGAAQGADFELEPAGSSLRFTAIQQGAKFESHFENFTAQVHFDPAQPEAGRITAQINLGSVDTGNPERDEVVAGGDWFNLAQWPEATFTANRIAREGEGYVAKGSLKLRDTTAPVTFRFRWTPETAGQPARLVGSASLERLAFGIGQGQWRDTSYVGNAVDVQADIRLRPVIGSVNSVINKGKTPNAR
ncbi:MAG: YceI family protein [Gammaproteobacteria bacterium]